MKRLPLFIIFVFLFSFLFFAPKTNNAWAAPTTLTASQDAMVQSLNPNSPYGSNSHLDIMKSYHPTLHPTLDGKTRSLVKFDLSSIPPNATIDSATFSIFLYGCNWTQTVNNLYIGRNKDPWQEYLVSWNNKPSFDAGSVINSTAPCTSVNQYLNYDIKPFVTGWMNGTYQNNGIVMYGNELAGVSWIKFFYGREDPANKPPKLVLTYTLPTSPTDGSTNVGTDNSSNTSGGETTSKPGEEKTATQSATIGAKKATVSTSPVESKGISAVRIALLAALTILLVGVVVGYIIYRRRKKLTSKKDKEPEVHGEKPSPQDETKEKEETKPESPVDK